MKNNKQTTLDLNGPNLSFGTQPIGVAATNGGSAIFTGIATATFNTIGIVTNTASNTGNVVYQWYEVGIGALSDSTYVVGTATTTLTLSRLITPTDNQKQYYLEANYVASAYGTVGSAKSTGNAINKPLYSSIGILTVLPLIEIIAQPIDKQAYTDTNTSFTIDASLSDSFFGTGVSYQWQLNGQNIDDGVFTTTTTTSTTIATQQEFNYSNDTTVTIPSSVTDIQVTVAGGSGGAGGNDAHGIGGGGGSGRIGKFSYTPGTERNLTFNIGRRGNGGGSGNWNVYGGGGSSDVAGGGRGGGAGNAGWSGGGGGGGGATGVYDNVVGAYTIVAGGGGGGGGGSLFRGAPGGSDSGEFSSSSGSFSFSEGNSGVDKGTAENKYSQGDGGGGGGGGGGAIGGGGGGAGNDEAFGGGGGSGGGSRNNSNVSTLDSQWKNDGDGYVNLKFTAVAVNAPTTVIRNTTVSGTKTPTLTIRSDFVGIQTVRCNITNIAATNSPIFSSVVNFSTVDNIVQSNINVENIGRTNSATLSSINLFNGDYELVATSSSAQANLVTEYYSLYAPDRDINVEMDLYGGKGTDVGSFLGGEGGFSRVRFTLIRNTEYVIFGLSTIVNTPFVYRKGQLIATVGGGGNAGTSGKGGFGGGIGVGAQNGFGRDSGTGGVIIFNGNLLSNGIFGSGTNLNAIAPDTKALAPNGGRVLSCAKGIYWKQQGVSACSDVGTTQFRLPDGTIVTNTATIVRGYKAGYGINETFGASSSNGGRGGNGATGGNGGVNGSGGGGGSGYTDGSVTVVSTQQGGSTGNAKIIIRKV